ncbi:hypothetical protein P691DRAFT_804128 [Macrolepiota fuliginosa MF-IS2]|uniref:Rho termination factor-like N-terminal domain-containing protein n=1 Tax=Macrolepiota fuliginosa MF-IS2 TaxID=1400762 RepID=A0A9P5XQA6_9AGAR|nr:hypothetical protein P691DRAFT_804128 [Macrolepiota fuliginosa MF-IS2]
MSMDLPKLTVPQLKALCKEKGLSGYSKLTKSALIEKLSAYTKSRVGGVTQTTNPTLPQPEKPTLQSKTDKKTYESQAEQVLVPIPQASVPREEGRPLANATNDQFQVDSRPTPAQNRAIEATQQTSILLQPIPEIRGVPQISQAPQTIEPPRKKHKLIHIRGEQKEEVAKSQQPARASNKADAPKTIPVAIQQANNKNQETTHIAKVTAVAVKRYVPLVIKQKDPTRTQEATRASNPIQPSSTPPLFVERIPAEHLDFPLPDESSLSFKAITLPPSLAQRRHASKLALILRDISIEDMPKLALSSRLFRYSGYLSAAYHLKRWYSGRRLEGVLLGISIDRMNLWPYRVAREEEVRKRREAFGKTFLGRFLGSDTGIEETVWKSGNDVRQAVIAVRCVFLEYY